MVGKRGEERSKVWGERHELERVTLREVPN